MSKSNTVELINNALNMAISQRDGVRGVLLHSDQGVQYTSTNYQSLMKRYGIVCSMSRKGNCWDNAAMESFYHSLKTEWVVFEDYRTRAQARSSLFEYIELFYNRKRRHSTLKYKSPQAYEQACVR
jgi:transposase InsO family protein